MEILGYTLLVAIVILAIANLIMVIINLLN